MPNLLEYESTHAHHALKKTPDNLDERICRTVDNFGIEGLRTRGKYTILVDDEKGQNNQVYLEAELRNSESRIVSPTAAGSRDQNIIDAACESHCLQTKLNLVNRDGTTCGCTHWKPDNLNLSPSNRRRIAPCTTTHWSANSTILDSSFTLDLYACNGPCKIRPEKHKTNAHPTNKSNALCQTKTYPEGYLSFNGTAILPLQWTTPASKIHLKGTPLDKACHLATWARESNTR